MQTASISKTKSGGRPTQRESEDRLQRLLDVAKRQFLSAGYRETSLEGIAREAGVAKKTLYSRFGSKAGLFATILDTLRRSWIAELQGLVLESNRPETVLETVALHLLQVGTRPDMIELYRLLLLDAHRFPELIRGYYDKGGGLSGMEPLSDYLRAAVAEDVLRIEEDRRRRPRHRAVRLSSARRRQDQNAAWCRPAPQCVCARPHRATSRAYFPGRVRQVVIRFCVA
jgi:TetR/AcrR family transcriptional repressor of mexJK operon